MLVAEGLSKTYRRHAVQVPVLTGLNLEVQTGEFLSIVGHSGSGKSTLLHLLGTLDEPDGGAVFLDDRRIDNLPAASGTRCGTRRSATSSSSTTCCRSSRRSTTC